LGAWGNCRWNIDAEGNRTSKFRITVNIKGEDSDFPRPKAIARYAKGKYGGGLRSEAIYDNINDLLIYEFGHEFYHFLARTEQCDFDPFDEVKAIKTGRRLVEKAKTR
jgi:hypothetical protein